MAQNKGQNNDTDNSTAMNPENEFRDGLDDLATHYRHILTLLGEDAQREGFGKDADARGKSHANTDARLHARPA